MCLRRADLRRRGQIRGWRGGASNAGKRFFRGAGSVMSGRQPLRPPMAAVSAFACAGIPPLPPRQKRGWRTGGIGPCRGIGCLSRGLQPGDQFAVRGRFVEPGSGGKICVYALAQLVPLLAQLLLAHPEGRTVTHGTCPSGGRCGRVVFQLTREGTEPLGELLMQYQRA